MKPAATQRPGKREIARIVDGDRGEVAWEADGRRCRGAVQWIPVERDVRAQCGSPKQGGTDQDECEQRKTGRRPRGGVYTILY